MRILALVALFTAGCDFAQYSPPPDLSVTPFDLAADLTAEPDLATSPPDLKAPSRDMVTPDGDSMDGGAPDLTAPPDLTPPPDLNSLLG